MLTILSIRDDIETVEEFVCMVYKIDPVKLHNKRRERTEVEVRQVIMYICMKLELSRNADLVLFYERDHATITHAVETIDGYIQVDRRFSVKMEDMIHKCNVLTRNYFNSVDL